jgi:hypothetical protein
MSIGEIPHFDRGFPSFFMETWEIFPDLGENRSAGQLLWVSGATTRCWILIMCPVLRSGPGKTIGKIIEGKIILSTYRKKFARNLLAVVMT